MKTVITGGEVFQVVRKQLERTQKGIQMTKAEKERLEYVENKLVKLKREFDKQLELLAVTGRMIEVMKDMLALDDDSFDDLYRKVKKDCK